MEKINIISWNVNGIRAVCRKGFLGWASRVKANTICLQEVKAHLEDIPLEIKENKKFSFASHEAQKKGYSGVLSMSKNAPIETEIGIKKKKFKSEGRTLIHFYDKFILFNCYFPNGRRDHSRVDYKLEYSEEIRKYAKKLEKKHNKPIIVCGDFNTAHKEIDLKNPKTNKNTTGFLPREREWIDKFIKSGFRDCFRELHPEKKDVYSWWSYRGDCRKKNVGWRIDYFFVSESLMPHVKKCEYLPKVEGSDHCPIRITLEI